MRQTRALRLALLGLLAVTIGAVSVVGPPATPALAGPGTRPICRCVRQQDVPAGVLVPGESWFEAAL